jgi:hypothetical protein
MAYISNINSLTSIYSPYFHSIIKYGVIFGVIHPTVERYLLYERKLSELWLVHDWELHVEVCLNN